MREGVIVLIALVALYIVIVLLRMAGLGRQSSLPLEIAPPPVNMPPLAENLPPEPPPPLEARQGEATASEEFERRRREREIFQLRTEVDALRDEVDAMRGELAALRQDMQRELAHMQAAQAVSPVYGDAVRMAAAGCEPALIAERCGIARAEAELVVALAKNQER
ncbi:MAG: DUF2802 domain-containing protein [Betaproteobacteria bacterium]|nr:DUF2802 domain-containing protein [Betaproteobacteria bacterium]